jgi:hypothetical protein
LAIALNVLVMASQESKSFFHDGTPTAEKAQSGLNDAENGLGSSLRQVFVRRVIAQEEPGKA